MHLWPLVFRKGSKMEHIGTFLNRLNSEKFQKLSFSSPLNCHFWRQITKMVTGVNSWIFTNSPYTLDFSTKIAIIEMTIFRKIAKIIIFVIFTQKWWFRPEIENFEISRNSAYLWVSFDAEKHGHNLTHKYFPKFQHFGFFEN